MSRAYFGTASHPLVHKNTSISAGDTKVYPSIAATAFLGNYRGDFASRLARSIGFA